MYELRHPTFEEGLGNNIPAQGNSYVPESNNNSNGLLVLLSLTTFFLGIAYTVNTIKVQNKKFENDFRQRLISTSKEQGKEIQQA
jgi:hypothetical protein